MPGFLLYIIYGPPRHCLCLRWFSVHLGLVDRSHFFHGNDGTIGGISVCPTRNGRHSSPATVAFDILIASSVYFLCCIRIQYNIDGRRVIKIKLDVLYCTILTMARLSKDINYYFLIVYRNFVVQLFRRSIHNRE